MKFIFIFLSIVFFLSINACKNDKNDSPVLSPSDSLSVNEILDFVTQYDRAWADRDTLKMQKLMGEKYVYFSSTGNLSTKANAISMFDPVNNYQIDTLSRSDIKFQINGNTAVISSHWVGRGEFAGKKFDDDQLCGMVIQKLRGEITIISEHCVQIAR